MADILSKAQKTKCKACKGCVGEARAVFELLREAGVDVDDFIRTADGLERQADLLLEAQLGTEDGGR